jgi:PTS system mannose-specific IIA component
MKALLARAAIESGLGNTRMIGTLILTHGGVARELLAAAEKIAGRQEHFAAVCLDWDDDCDTAERKIQAGIRQVEAGDGVLVLTDTYGGTPCNLALHFRVAGKVEVVSGVNLPMVMRLACNGNRRPAGLAEIAEWLQDKGRESIRVAGERPALAACEK